MGAAGSQTLSLPQEQGFGWGVNLGLLYRASDALTLGAAYLPEQHMRQLDWHVSAGSYTLELNGPAQLVLGLGWKPAPGWLVAADIKHIFSVMSWAQMS